MPTHTIGIVYSAGGLSFPVSSSVTDTQEINIDLTLAPLDTNKEIDVVMTRSLIKSLMITSVGGDLTIKTNSTGSPGDTVVMTAGQETVWSSVAGIGTNPFATADVTKLYLTSTAGTKFSLRSIYHSAV